MYVCCSPDLHWRDVQELIIRSSKTDDLKSGSFVVNGVGRKGTAMIINSSQFLLFLVLESYILVKSNKI